MGTARPDLSARLTWLRGRTSQLTPLLVATVIGVGGGLGAIGFRFLVKGVQQLFWGTSDFSTLGTLDIPWYLILILPAVGGILISPIVTRWAPEIKGSGIPEVMEGVSVRGGRVRRRVAPLKALAAAICIGTGGSAGREGPIVHVGAAIGSAIARFFRSTAGHTRTYVGCGAAAGIAATFNTPFAGVLFAAEVILRDFHLARFSPIVVASVVAVLVSHGFIGNFPAIAVPRFDLVSYWELISYLAIGLASALVSVLFIRAMEDGWRVLPRLGVPAPLRPAAGGLVVGIIALAVPQVLGVGYETINDCLAGHMGLWLALAVLVAKLAATVATLASGGSGGVFAPCLVMGGLIGHVIGQATGAIAPDMAAAPQAYALVAMGAMVAAATRAPISAVLMIFEMSNRFEVILPLMVACVPATLLSALLKRDSVYVAKLTFRGVDLTHMRDPNVLKGVRVEDVRRERVPHIAPAAPLDEVFDLFLKTDHTLAFVVDEDQQAHGYIEARDLRPVLSDRDVLTGLLVAADLASPLKGHLEQGDELTKASQALGMSGLEALPVVDRQGRVVGDVSQRDVLDTYLDELTARDMPSVAANQISLTERVGAVDLGGGAALVELEAPPYMVGLPLRGLDLRGRYGVQVVLIGRDDQRGHTRVVPKPDDVLRAGDKLLLVGEAADIERMKG